MTAVNQLQWLLEPVPPQSFLAEYLGRRVLVVAGVPTKFDGLLSLDDYQRILAGIRDSVRSFQHRPSLAHRISLAGPDGYLNMDGVFSGYAQGSTAYLDEAERRHPPLQRLCNQIEEGFWRLGMPLAQCGPAVVFLTPIRSQAIGPHTDPKDLFILQLEGTKHWRFYGDSARLGPPGEQPLDTQLTVREVVLEPGSVAYIPCGFIHAALTSDTYSLAVTIGFTSLSWRNVIQDLLETHLSREVEWNLPLQESAIEHGKLTSSGQRALGEILTDISNSATFLSLARGYSTKQKTEVFRDWQTFIDSTLSQEKR